MNHPYACPICAGSGETTCSECEQNTDCEACDGTGLDGRKMDVRAFQREHLVVGVRTGAQMWGWVLDGVLVGLRNGVTGVPYAEFALDASARSLAPKRFANDPAQRKLFEAPRPAPDEYVI